MTSSLTSSSSENDRQTNVVSEVADDVLVARYTADGGGIWERLHDHLVEVGERSGHFANAFGAAQLGRLLGRWHDLGKASDAFQVYIRDSVAGRPTSTVDHSTAAAQLAAEFGPIGHLLAPLLAGHHGGLPDAVQMSGQSGRLHKTLEPWREIAKRHLADLMDDDGLANQRPPFDVAAIESERRGFALATFGRMLFSALVDADSLVSERLENPEREDQRRSIDLSRIGVAFDHAMADFAATAESTDLNLTRAEILAACRAAAKSERGLFSLTVPTGGGKTFASLAFALDHVRHQTTLENDQPPMQGIVYAIPFTSIIDQTTHNFRDLLGELGDESVLEHHGQIIRERSDGERDEPHLLDLAAENFDHPLIVTTNVQLLESLFAAKRSRCRKLHNLAGRVLIFDEAQTLPMRLLKPTLFMLRELVERYGCTVVLCTATQPALTQSDRLPFGLPTVREIINEPAKLADRLKRVEVSKLGSLDDDQLVDRLANHDQVLCIVNSRRHAADLATELGRQLDDRTSVIHLSTRMCGAHRRERIAEIRRRLKRSEPCRVVSTQLIEAGVDVDFPVVYRDRCGLDSLAQAAGRCNREGKLVDPDGRPAPGHVHLFEADDVTLGGYLLETWQVASKMLPDIPEADLLTPSTMRRYFERRIDDTATRDGSESVDPFDRDRTNGRVVECFPFTRDLAFNYRTAAERYRLIEDEGIRIVVPYGEGHDLLEQIEAIAKRPAEARFVSRDLHRRLQPFSVSLYEHEFDALLAAGCVHDPLADAADEPIGSILPFLNDSTRYDERLGLRLDAAGSMDTDSHFVL